ncbi:MAG TPA: DUF883 family protein [Steroidobacteraceae bacterium]|jgi:ElaB/YqjD/DUF883 family membrane-anchored ribosome-binding protein
MRSVTAGRAAHNGANRRNAGARAARASRQAALDSAKDFHSLISDAEALLKSTVDVVGEQAAEARSRLQRSMAQARDHLAEDLESLTDHGRNAVSAADEFVHERPWPVIGLTALTAVMAGFLLSRR